MQPGSTGRRGVRGTGIPPLVALIKAHGVGAFWPSWKKFKGLAHFTTGTSRVEVLHRWRSGRRHLDPGCPSRGKSSSSSRSRPSIKAHRVDALAKSVKIQAICIWNRCAPRALRNGAGRVRAGGGFRVLEERVGVRYRLPTAAVMVKAHRVGALARLVKVRKACAGMRSGAQLQDPRLELVERSERRGS